MLAVVQALGSDLGLAALALADMSPPQGRGRHHTVALDGGSFQLIDDSYNASPVAVRAALDILGRVEPGARGRRIAVLGDMLELGDDADKLHADLAEEFVGNAIDLVYLCGPHMAVLNDMLPQRIRGAWAEDSAALLAQVIAAVRPGDVVLVKGSLGSRMAPVVDALLHADAAPASARAR